MKRILVTGSESYIGSVLTSYLRKNGYEVTGIDAGFITDCLLYPTTDTATIYKDTRNLKESDFKSFDAVVYLAGISNDPFRSFDPKKIYDPVRNHTIKAAKLCKKLGIKFIFSSSCSVYGKGTDKMSDEKSAVFPQTPYSLNKLQIEQDLAKLTDENFRPIALRFATVFGLSPRMRFDLVVNMFAAMGYITKKIILNSDGQAWRPFVHVRDVCKAIKYAIEYKPKTNLLTIVNVGSSKSNFKIIDLAKKVSKKIPGCEVSFISKSQTFNKELIQDRKLQDGVDSRNYKISFDKIKKIFKGFKCDYTIEKGIREMIDKYCEIELTKKQFENIKFYRLQKFEDLIKKGLITEKLEWIKQ